MKIDPNKSKGEYPENIPALQFGFSQEIIGHVIAPWNRFNNEHLIPP
jgi:hypothetical protein